MPFLLGFSIALGLIVAIGAQNAWVLGMSVRRVYPWSIAIVCFTIDAGLMGIGTLFFARIQSWLPGVVPLFTWLGILMLAWLAIKAATRVYQGDQSLEMNDQGGTVTRSQAIGTAFAISLLNPHVYLDTVVLVGSLASSSASPLVFWLGAASASVLWFSSLAAIGKPLRHWLSSVRRWQIFDGLMALIMAWVAFSLYLSL